MEDDIAKAVRDARAAALLAFFCLLLLGVMLMVDGQRNKWLLGQISEARQILNDFQAAARTVAAIPERDARGRFTKAVEDGAGTTVTAGLGGATDNDVHAGGDSPAGVGTAAAAGTRVDPPGRRPVPAQPPAANGRAGMAGGPRGHG